MTGVPMIDGWMATMISGLGTDTKRAEGGNEESSITNVGGLAHALLGVDGAWDEDPSGSIPAENTRGPLKGAITQFIPPGWIMKQRMFKD